ncbi:MAG TPA: ATP-binding protein [Longimicrobiaceae bacterium]|nr:ATP-binding protein [Longimicrobiaceae bacterium]
MQYHLFVERVRDYAIFLMDRDGVITHWGEGAVRMKEFTPEEVVGRHLRMLYPPGGAEDGTADEHLRIAAEQGEYIGEGMRVARDRGRFPARVVLTALRHNGELYGFSKVTQDLTEQKRTEERLRQALHAAEAASVEKSRFLATMSHEIRTPINAVLGYADLLDLGIGGPLTDAQRGYLDRVRASGRHLLALIEDVLDFARVEGGRLAMQPRRFPAAQAAEAALMLLRPQAEARGLSLELLCGPEVEYWGDETRVQQILANLIGNATKFTEPGGTIRVTCGDPRPDPEAELRGPGPWTCIRVEDSGIGIPADRLTAVFEPFVQVDNALTRVHQGTGLGLAISRRLARLMGGDLTVRSREGAGSVFTLWLPASPTGVDRPEGEEGVPPEAGSLTPVGHYLGSTAHEIVRAFTMRLRAEPGIPQARERTRSELEDHLATLLTDMAQALVVIEEDGPDAPATAQDGSDVQALISGRHAVQRRRLGWSEAALVREYEILREEVESALRQAAGAMSESAVDESLAVVRRLLARATEISLRAFRDGGAAGREGGSGR